MAPPMIDRKPKTIYQLDTPFSTVSWPQIKSEDQETILELLINLLSPIGYHRATHIVPSNGKRSKKRKREQTMTDANENPQPLAPSPELSSHLLVGLASVTRHLESLSRVAQPKAIRERLKHKDVEESAANNSIRDDAALSHLAAVFTSQISQSPGLDAHLPQLIASASQAHPHLPPTKLVQLPKGCDERIAASLGLPRASLIAICEDAPYSKPLLEFLDKHVPPVHICWLQEAVSREYKQVCVNAIKTTFPIIKKKSKSGLKV